MNKFKKQKILTLVLFSMFFFLMIFQSNITNYQYSDDNDSINVDGDAKSADERPDVVIYINGSSDSWDDAKTAGWVDDAGDGSYGNPYVIKNKVIDGENSKHGILIENYGWYTFYYRIENCSFINIGPSDGEKAGIALYHLKFDFMMQGSGVIQNNTFETNFALDNYGIFSFHSANHTISNNIFTDFSNGIYLDNETHSISITENLFTDNRHGIKADRSCYDINIMENIFRDNLISGIYIINCYDFLISDNLIEDNNNYGVILSNCLAGWFEIWLPYWPWWEYIYRSPIIIRDNTISKNKWGIYLEMCIEQQVTENTISENSEEGISLFLSDVNNITDNLISDNTKTGVIIDEGYENFVYGNYFYRNGEHAVECGNKNNFSYYDWFLDRGIGNYWDNYSQIDGVADVDDDEIGDAWYNFTGGHDKYPIYNDGIEGDVIEIDGFADGIGAHNWTWATDRFWCSGSGTFWDPYVISPSKLWDGNVDAGGKLTAISIKNTFVYFKIEDLTLFGASEAGIKLNNTQQGDISNNNISNNGYGLFFDGAASNNITENIISDNTNTGIYLTNYSDFNYVLDNTISDNDIGTYLEKESKENKFISNIFDDNSQYGAVISDLTCNFSIFSENIFRGNKIEYALDNGPDDAQWYINERGNSWKDYTDIGPTAADIDDDGIGDVPYAISGSANAIDHFPLFEDELDGNPLYINGAATGVNAHNWTWASKRLYISGNGTQINPYVIADVTINGDASKSAIFIENSDWTLNIYFRIENCILNAVGGDSSNTSAIRLDNVTNGEIIANDFSTDNNWNYGIHMERCGYILIEENNISSNEQFSIGIYLDKDSHHMNIVENEVSYNAWGIYLHNMTNNNNITRNTIENNDYSGIYMSNCSNNNVMYNFINDNGNGTKLDNGGSNHKIYGNIIQNNDDYGLIINHSQVQWALIYNNTFSSNGLDGLVNARDDGRWNDWNTTSIGNDWSVSGYKANVQGRGFVAEDTDDDGIGDVNYTISGSANSTDGKPIYDDGFDGDNIYIDGDEMLSEGYTILGSYIYVMTWDEAVEKVWCTGSGTPDNPYVIKDIKVNAGGTNSSIHIQGSYNKHFRIENCELINSSEENNTAGIYLYNTNNGEIINNNISLNGQTGIYLYGSNNITIMDNVIEQNGYYGIFTYSWCYNIYISNNSFKENGLGEDGSGIHMHNIGGGGFNLMSHTIYDNTFEGDNVGISVKNTWNWNPPVTISDNIIKSSALHGIAIIDFCDNLQISGNTINYSGDAGIYYGWKSFKPNVNSTITGNNIYNNTGYGIRLNQFLNSIVSGNTISGNLKGIAAFSMCKSNTFTNNLILNNDEHGMLFLTSSGDNDIYNNNFTGNLISAKDSALDENTWYKEDEKLGNYWDDYVGKDTDDDNIGDNPIDYWIPEGLGASKDDYPIFWDGPDLLILKPQDDDEIPAELPPGKGIDYTINITEGIGDFLWYDIDGTFSTPIPLPLRVVDEQINNEIPGSVWELLSDGLHTITFYINDSRGYVTSDSVDIIKLNATTQVAPTVSSSSTSSSDDTATEEELMPWYIQAAMTGAVSASVGLIIKQTYSSAKKRKIILEKIHENFARVDNLETFLKDKLAYEDWEKIQEPWQQYQKDLITERQMIKQSKKSLGKKFTELFIPHKKSKRRTT